MGNTICPGHLVAGTYKYITKMLINIPFKFVYCCCSNNLKVIYVGWIDVLLPTTSTQNKTYYVLQDCSPLWPHSCSSYTISIPTDPRIRKFHPFTYRHLHAFKDPYKYSFFPNTIIHWNLLPQTIVLYRAVNTFREQLTPTVLSHLQSQI